MKAINLPPDNQHDAFWVNSRLGRFTGSECYLLMKRGRSKDAIFSDTTLSYIYRKMAERNLVNAVINGVEEDEWGNIREQFFALTGQSSRAMEFGTNREPEARAAYYMATRNIVLTTGSIVHPSISTFSDSPDGCVADSNGDIVGCVEIKCPMPETFVRYCVNIHDNETLKSEKDQYYWQCQAHMLCTGASWCDFVVYNPFINNHIHIVRINRNDDDIKALETRIIEAERFITEHPLNG